MSTGLTEQPPTSSSLSEAERAAAFRRTEPKVPRNFVLIVAAAFAVLALGGVLGERLLSSVGLNPASTIATTTTAVPRAIAPPATAPLTPQVGASLSRFMGITRLTGRPAPALSLTDQTGHTVSLGDQRGDVVVLTFFDSRCQDICPVLSDELLRAATDLGPAAAHVAFLTVNTDPVALSAAPAAAAGTGLGTLATWHFLTSNLGALNHVWKAYGVSVNVSRASGLVAHNDVMYFIDPAGRLRYEATPFADESSSGAFSLPPASIARWGQGIARYAAALLGSPA
ncbi:MAG TPA: SCO family protein [Acidimicrobiales bacterium]|nr:SCO family protein [Acidimicrobiales bacterium]